MKGIVIKTDNTMTVQEFTRPLHKSLGSAVGGYIEHVHPMMVSRPYCMIVNEEGKLIGLPVNPFACVLYGTSHHGEPIVGDVVIMKDGFFDGEPDIVGLDDSEVSIVAEQITKFTHGGIRLTVPGAAHG